MRHWFVCCFFCSERQTTVPEVSSCCRLRHLVISGADPSPVSVMELMSLLSVSHRAIANFMCVCHFHQQQCVAGLTSPSAVHCLHPMVTFPVPCLHPCLHPMATFPVSIPWFCPLSPSHGDFPCLHPMVTSPVSIPW